MADAFNQYITALRANLKAKCGSAKSESILAEALTHLEEAIQDLVASGQTREEAERLAMTRFGDVSSVCAWYAEQHARPSVWRASRWPLVALTAFGLFWNYQYLFTPGWLSVLAPTVVQLNFFFALVVFACFRSKRFTAGVMLAISVPLCAIFFGALCCFGAPIKGLHGYGVIAKWSVDATIQAAKERQTFYERLLPTLQLGAKAFAPLAEPSGGVGQFHDSRGYLSPIYFQSLDPKIKVFFGNRPVDGVFSNYKVTRGYWIDQRSLTNAATGQRQNLYITHAENQIKAARLAIGSLAPATQGLPPLSFAEKATAFGKTVLLVSGFILFVGLVADLLGGGLRLLVAYLKRVKRVTPLVS